MANYKNVIEDFNRSLWEVATVWREQRDNFSDPKIEQFGTQILQPLSTASERINQQVGQVDDAIHKLMEKGLL